MLIENIDINKSLDCAFSRFDWIRDGQKTGANHLCDIELAGDTNAAIVPTLGSFVSDWLLLVPRVKALSYAALHSGAREQALQLLSNTTKQKSPYSGGVTLFEHGASSLRSITGCGVDQAHLHVIPCIDGFDTYVVASDDELEWVTLSTQDPWNEIEPEKDYYFISNGQINRVAYPTTKTSQYLRKKLASFLERPEDWDYRTKAYFENVRKTVDRFIK